MQLLNIDFCRFQPISAVFSRFQPFSDTFQKFRISLLKPEIFQIFRSKNDIFCNSSCLNPKFEKITLIIEVIYFFSQISDSNSQKNAKYIIFNRKIRKFSVFLAETEPSKHLSVKQQIIKSNNACRPQIPSDIRIFLRFLDERRKRCYRPFHHCS